MRKKPYLLTLAMVGLIGLMLAAAVKAAGAQESLGDRARRLREAKENAANAAKTPSGGQKAMSPTAADMSATMAMVSETDPDKYADGVRLLFEQERFRVLDDIAAAERTNKTRFAGGEWKLNGFYAAIASPGGKGRGVVADWNAYRDRLNRWVGLLPTSMTARVAQAQAELLYAWELRGPGEAGTIEPAKFDRFMEHLAQAETILNQASELQVKCPEWYNVMLQVGRAKGLDVQDVNALLERATAFEPQYFYVYQQQALTLTPKWRGKEGDAEKFAEEQANRVGGKAGDILYWQIAQSVMGNPELAKMPQHFVWSRALVGYQGMVEQYGLSLQRQNQIAFVAARFGDYTAADDMFARIGDHWDKGTWGTQEYFEKVREWARSTAAPFKKIVEAYKAVSANVATLEGQKYDGQIAKEFTARYARSVQDCTAPASGPQPTLLIMQVGKTGTVQQMLVVPDNASDACLRPKLEKAYFSPPPKPEYWVRVSLK